MTAIHSACAAAVARQHHRDDTVRFLRSEIRKLEQKIDMDEKMKKMGDMQLASVTETKKRKTILEQVELKEGLNKDYGRLWTVYSGEEATRIQTEEAEAMLSEKWWSFSHVSV